MSTSGFEAVARARRAQSDAGDHSASSELTATASGVLVTLLADDARRRAESRAVRRSTRRAVHRAGSRSSERRAERRAQRRELVALRGRVIELLRMRASSVLDGST